MLKSYNTVLQADTVSVICQPEQGHELAVNSLSIFGGSNGGYVTISIGKFSMQHSVSANARIVFPFFMGVTKRYPMTATSNNDDIRICVAAEQFVCDPIDYSKEPLTIKAEEPGATVALSSNGPDINTERAIKYKINDAVEWTCYKSGDVITLDNVGDTVKFWNETEIWHDTIEYNGYIQFIFTKNVSVYGNIRSLINYKTQMPVYGFKNLFLDCQSLISAENLIIDFDSISYYGLENMFSNCTSLITAPELPATTLSVYCYQHMFYFCQKLINAPKILPAKTLSKGCYASMFNFCTSLIDAPKILANACEDYCCSEMFANCTSLINAPDLLIESLRTSCYESMFANCTSLINAPKIMAIYISSNCCNSMFINCVNLINGPELLATDLLQLTACYSNMFAYCQSLQTIKVHFSDWGGGSGDAIATYQWMLDAGAAKGIFYKPSALPEEYGNSKIPEGWTVVNID